MTATALAWRQLRFERKLFWRNPSAAFFNFALPLIFLLLVATVFGLEQDELNHFVPGIAAMSILTTTFTALAHNITALREGGILKRMRGTPLPPVSYLTGLIGSAVVNAVIRWAMVLALGHFL